MDKGLEYGSLNECNMSIKLYFLFVSSWILFYTSEFLTSPQVDNIWTLFYPSI